jgi:serine protease Do
MQIDVVIGGDAFPRTADEPQTVPAEVVGLAPDLDLAVLRVRATGLSALPLAHTRVRQGDPTLTVAPGAQGTHVMAAGVVIAPGAPVREDSPVPYLVTNAAESVAGAPVVNAAGELVGLAVAFVDEAGVHAPATAALPAALLEVTLAHVRSATPWRRGVIGLSARSAVRPSADGATMSEEAHLVVAGVAAGLPADRAGVRAGDVIVSINHQPVDGMDLSTLYLALYTLREGQALVLGVQRHGEFVEVSPTAVSVRDVFASR